MSTVVINSIDPKASKEDENLVLTITGTNFTDGGDPVVYVNDINFIPHTFTSTELEVTINTNFDANIYTLAVANGQDEIDLADGTTKIWKLTNTELIRYITDQSTSISLGNETCYTKPSIWLIYDEDGAKGDFGAIMKVCPPNANIDYEQVFLKYNENFNITSTTNKLILNDIILIDGDKIWLSNQLNSSENGLYYIIDTIEIIDPNSTTDDIDNIIHNFTVNFYRTVDDTVFVDLAVRAYDTVDGDLSRQIITEQNINFDKIGFYTINYYVLNSQGILSTEKRKVKIIECNASIAPTGSIIISDYLIKTEVDTSVLNPDNILNSCNACDLSEI